MKTEFDVVVIGGGASGIAAARAATDCGSTTAVIERLPFLGGMATAAEVGTVCGLYTRANTDDCTVACSGFAEEFCRVLAESSHSRPLRWREGLRFLPYEPSKFKSLAWEVLEQSSAHVMLNSTLLSACAPATQWRLTVSSPLGNSQILARALVDCSGNSIASSLAGFPVRANVEHQAAAFVFQLAPIEDPARAKFAIFHSIATGISEGKLPRAAEHLSIVPSAGIAPNTMRFKLGLPPGELSAPTPEAEVAARTLVGEIVEYLKCSNRELHRAQLVGTAHQIGIRSGSIPRGRYTLSEQDVLSCRRFEDTVALGAWPIEFWGAAREPHMQYFPANTAYSIPASALESLDCPSLFFAGKVFSATERALASARVIGTCLATGYAAGALASAHVQSLSRGNVVQRLYEQQCRLLDSLN